MIKELFLSDGKNTCSMCGKLVKRYFSEGKTCGKRCEKKLKKFHEDFSGYFLTKSGRIKLIKLAILAKIYASSSLPKKEANDIQKKMVRLYSRIPDLK